MNRLKTVFVLCAVSLATGCTISGETGFTCPDPENGVCTDAHTAFILAEQGKTASDFKEGSHLGHESSTQKHEHHSDDGKHDHGRSEFGEHGGISDDSENPYRDIAPIAGLMRMPEDQPKPVLMQATVLEAWVNVWVDENDVLRLPSSAFVEITPRRWSLDGTKVEDFKTQGPFVTTTQE